MGHFTALGTELATHSSETRHFRVAPVREA
jgi:hypothetical protein